MIAWIRVGRSVSSLPSQASDTKPTPSVCHRGKSGLMNRSEPRRIPKLILPRTELNLQRILLVLLGNLIVVSTAAWSTALPAAVAWAQLDRQTPPVASGSSNYATRLEETYFSVLCKRGSTSFGVSSHVLTFSKILAGVCGLSCSVIRATRTGLFRYRDP